MLELVLVRHGRVAHLKNKICYGWTDMDLDEDGVLDAKRAGNYLKDEAFDAVYASPLLRTMQTANIVLAQNTAGKELSIQTVENLKEYNFGLWEGMAYAKLKSEYEEDWKRYLTGSRDFMVENGETFETFIGRVCQAVDTIKQKHPNGRVLVVTHYGCISVIIPYLLNIIGDMEWKFAVDPGGVCKLEVVEDFARLTKLNV